MVSTMASRARAMRPSDTGGGTTGWGARRRSAPHWRRASGLRWSTRSRCIAQPFTPVQRRPGRRSRRARRGPLPLIAHRRLVKSLEGLRVFSRSCRSRLDSSWNLPIQQQRVGPPTTTPERRAAMQTTGGVQHSVRPEHDPLADPGWQEPATPVERLSWLRLGLLVLLLAGLAGSGTAAVLHLRDTSGPTAKSWAVPYVDVTLTPRFEFQDPGVNPANTVALAFVVADPKDRCSPSWGGVYTLDEAAGSLELDRRISQLRSAGGDISLSVGGLSNTELAVACIDQPRLTDAYPPLAQRYDVQTLALDIEGTAVADEPSLRRRALALATLQSEREAAGRPLAVWLTLSVTPQGLTADGLDAVRTTLAGGVALRGVNVMTMDFGSEQGSHPDMLDLTTRALTSTHRQLSDLSLRLGVQLTSPEVWSRLGATPMIGQNDVDSERFTVDDARKLASFALDTGLGRVSMWSLNRDTPCRGTFANVVVHADTCSGVAQDALAFSSVFAGLPGAAVGTSGQESVTLSTQEPVVDDPRTTPYPVWRLTAESV